LIARLPCRKIFGTFCYDAIENGGVVPVVGGDLLRVVGRDGAERHFSQCVAETLALGLGAENAPVDLQGLVAAELRSGREEDELFQELAAAHLRALEQAEPAKALRLLAGITDFSLFLSTTTDGLLARAISLERGLAPAVRAAKIFDSIDLAPELAWAPGAAPATGDLPFFRPDRARTDVCAQRGGRARISVPSPRPRSNAEAAL
jgi:hypothetical protein